MSTENANNYEANNNSSSKLLKIFVFLTVILAIACIVLTVTLFHYKNVAQVETIAKEEAIGQKEDMLCQLRNLETEYNQLSKDYKGLDSLFNKEKERIKKLKNEIKNLKGDASAYKNKIALLEGRLKDYLAQIEELKAKNEALTAENIKVKTTLDSAVTQNTQLNTQNQELSAKVEAGSVLKAYEIFAEPIRIKGEKEIPTKKAKKTQKIRVCFLISENAIAKKGTKNVYIRIAEPDGTVLAKGTDDSYTFTYQDKNLAYSIKKEINYDNKAMDMCIYWEKNKDFKPGMYNVDIYVDDMLVGTTTYMLE